MSKDDNTFDNNGHGNDFIADIGRSSFFTNPKDWNLFQLLYAILLWHLLWCGLINLLYLAFS
jgi:hypothetical protein